MTNWLAAGSTVYVGLARGRGAARRGRVADLRRTTLTARAGGRARVRGAASRSAISWTYALVTPLRRGPARPAAAARRLARARSSATSGPRRSAGTRSSTRRSSRHAEERDARLDTYLALLASPVPSVVKEGLTGLKALEPPVPGAELARAAAPALTLPQKAIALDVLRLLGRASRASPRPRRRSSRRSPRRSRTSTRTCRSGRSLLLEKPPGSVDRVRVVLALADAVSPTLRPRLDALHGLRREPGRSEPPVRIPVPAQPPADAAAGDPHARRARAGRGRSTTWSSSRRRCSRGRGRATTPSASSTASRASGPSATAGSSAGRARSSKRARRAPAGCDPTVRGAGAEIVARVVLAWTARQAAAEAGRRSTLIGFLGLRAAEVARPRRRPREARARCSRSRRTPAAGSTRDVLARRTRRGSRHGSSTAPTRSTCGRRSSARSALEPLRADPSCEPLAERCVKTSLRGPSSRRSRSRRRRELPPECATGFRRPPAPSDDPLGQVVGSLGRDRDALGVRWAPDRRSRATRSTAYGHALRDAVVQREGAGRVRPPRARARARARRRRCRSRSWAGRPSPPGLLGRPQEVKRAAVDVVVAVGRRRPLRRRAARGRARMARRERPRQDRAASSSRSATRRRVSPLPRGRRSRVTVVGVRRAVLPSTPQGLVGPLELERTELVGSDGLSRRGPAPSAPRSSGSRPRSRPRRSWAARRARSSARAPRERSGRQRVAFLALLRALPAACCALPLTVCAAPLASIRYARSAPESFEGSLATGSTNA